MGDVQAAMEPVGEIAFGGKHYQVWFANERFTFPGIYLWNGKANVCIVDLEQIENQLKGTT